MKNPKDDVQESQEERLESKKNADPSHYSGMFSKEHAQYHNLSAQYSQNQSKSSMQILNEQGGNPDENEPNQYNKSAVPSQTSLRIEKGDFEQDKSLAQSRTSLLILQEQLNHSKGKINPTVNGETLNQSRRPDKRIDDINVRPNDDQLGGNQKRSSRQMIMEKFGITTNLGTKKNVDTDSDKQEKRNNNHHIFIVLTRHNNSIRKGIF